MVIVMIHSVRNIWYFGTSHEWVHVGTSGYLGERYKMWNWVYMEKRFMSITSEAHWVELLGMVHHWYAQHGLEYPSA